jgi:CheY-like chemotaxis protein
MRILFIDDEPENVSLTREILIEVLRAEVDLARDVQEAIARLHQTTYDLVVTDIFVPLGEAVHGGMGPRARRAAEGIEHLGGLVLLDEIDRLDHPPKVLIHTACTDYALIRILDEHKSERVRKPASPDVLLKAVMEALGV